MITLAAKCAVAALILALWAYLTAEAWAEGVRREQAQREAERR